MTMRIRLARPLRLIAGALTLALWAAPQALAQNNYTSAGTNVQSTFTLNYTVAGVAQPQIDNTGSPTEFTVDRLVDLNVSYQTNSDDDEVAPGAQNEELVFRVRNDGNDNFAYALSAVNEAGDDFDTQNLEIRFYVDDGDGVYQPGGADGAPVNFSGATSDIAPDRILWVEVIGDIPVSQPDLETSSVTLVADSLQPTTWVTEGAAASPGTPIAADDGTNTIGSTAENILADGSGTSNEVANAGDHSDTGVFTVSSPDLAATKTVSVIATNLAGTFNCQSGAQVSANEYSVPGSCLEYRIEVVNSGSAAAGITTISDTLPDELTFVDAVFTNFTGGTPAEPAASTDCSGGACVISQTGGTVASSTTASIVIRATVK